MTLDEYLDETGADEEDVLEILDRYDVPDFYEEHQCIFDEAVEHYHDSWRLNLEEALIDDGYIFEKELGDD